MARAILIHRPDVYETEEARALAEAGGYEVVGSLTQKYLSKAKYGVGAGKAEEAAELVRETRAEKMIFDSSLTTSQSYNLAKLSEAEVVDREKLILEILARRASTAEAKLQVELAELAYELPKARDMVRIAKKGEQPGFFGLGKYEVDVYVRMMRRVSTLRKKVKTVSERREIFRYRRERTGLSTVAITGYTGAGKTALFNRLTGEAKKVDSGVFTTLSPTTRGIDVDGGRRVMLTVTVGFISRLPHFLVEAFKSTLEEVSQATAVLLLLDASLPPERMALNCRSCFKTLSELDVPDTRIIVAMNKSDLVSERDLVRKMQQAGIKSAIFLSARTGEGVPNLLREVSEALGGIRATRLEGLRN